MVDERMQPADDEIALHPVAVGPDAATRRRALWGVLAVVAVVTGAVVVSSGGDGRLERLPVTLGSLGGREAAGAAMSADMSLAWVTYKAGDGLPALGGEAAAYRLDGRVERARVRALAEALDLQGDPTHDEGIWRVTAGDAVLEVYEDNGSSWWYSANQGAISSGGGTASCDPSGTKCEVTVSGSISGSAEPATTVPAEECAAEGASCASDTPTSDCPPNAECVEPSPPPEPPCATDADCSTEPACPPDTGCAAPEPILPPADLPSKAEARELALDLLTAAGMDVGDAKVTVDGPYDAWYVNVEPVVDGLPVSGWIASVSVGSKGAIVNASGSMATLERLGDYPLLDTRAAIDRLNEMQGGFGGGPVPMGAPDGVARDTGVATLDVGAAESPCRSDDPTCLAIVDTDAPITTVVSPCKVQPDGSEICEAVGQSVPECPVPLGTDDPAALDRAQADCAAPGICSDYSIQPVDPGGVPETTVPSPECTEPIPYPYPYPEPEPVEVTLTDAELVLTWMPAYDGSGAAYLVPGYRFSNTDGVIIDVPAVDDDSLAPTTTVPETTEPKPVPPAVEPAPVDPTILEPGQTPEIGVGYYVDVDVVCAAFTLGDEIWRHDVGDLAGWSAPHEGGTFTLDAPDHGTFVGDANGDKTATFVTGTDPEGCIPAPRG